MFYFSLKMCYDSMSYAYEFSIYELRLNEVPMFKLFDIDI